MNRWREILAVYWLMRCAFVHAGQPIHPLEPLIARAIGDATAAVRGPDDSSGIAPILGYTVRVLDISRSDAAREWVYHVAEHRLTVSPQQPSARAAADTRTAVRASSASAVVLFSVDFTDPYFRSRAKCAACRLALLHAGSAAALLTARVRDRGCGAQFLAEIDDWLLYRAWKLPAREMFVCAVVVW